MRKYLILGSGILQPIVTTICLIFPLSINTLAESLGNLNNTQIQSLENLGIPVALPNYIPPGFSVSKFTTQGSPTSGRSSYEILYRNSDNHCFYISGFMGGTGGPEAGFLFTIETSLFGKTTINIGAVFDGSSYNKIPSPEQLNSPQSEIWSFSVKDSVIYGIGTEEKREGCTINQTITPLEIKKIMQSMTWL
ncbi:hypothetical protein [Planktothrix pseudagardhii]|nr:hypothetical protein [Planktothrix pseudagardhii]